MDLKNKIELKMPKDHTFIRFPVFKWLESKQSFLIGTGYSSFNSEQEFFKHSNLLSIFDHEGNLTQSFGTFPTYFKEKSSFNTYIGLYHVNVSDDYLYLLFGNSPDIYKYDFKGNLLSVLGQKSSKMNYMIKTRTASTATRATLNDLNYKLAKDINKNTFYYSSLIVKDGLNGNKLNTENWLLQFDFDNKTYSEIQFPLNYTLMDRVVNDTIAFLVSDKTYDEKYILRAILK